MKPRNNLNRNFKKIEIHESEEVKFRSKVVKLSDDMSNLKTEIWILEAEIIADKERTKEEQTRRVFESIVEEFQQRIVLFEKEKQLAKGEKGYGIYQREVFIRDL